LGSLGITVSNHWIYVLIYFLIYIEPNIFEFNANSYSLVLRHTTEEVYAACIESIEPDQAARTSRMREKVMAELGENLNKHTCFEGFDIVDELPVKYSIEQWVELAKESKATVFIAG
jgi:hypothetical protein